MLGDGIDRSTVRNLVVITMDTTRADRIGAYGYDAIETPHIDALAEHGVLFETAIVPVPLTLPSHTSIFSGLYPIHHGVRNNGTFQVPDRIDTMAELLRQKGFSTAAVIGAFVLDSKFGLDQGFQTYDDNLHAGKKGPMFMFDERPGRMVTDQGLAWLEAHADERFFLWLHYFDPHANYEPPPPFDVLYDGRPYEGEIAGVDAEIGRVVASLRDLNRLDETLIVLTSDHGESLGEHGERTHSLLLYDATLRVPLIVTHPALPQGVRVRGQVRVVDVLPTVLDLLALPAPAQLDGASLVPLMNGDRTADRESYVETLVPYFNNAWAELRGVRTTEHKYIRAPRSELYELEADPGETKNVLEERFDVAARFAKRLDEYLAGDVLRTGEGGAAKLELSAADRERLAALGYQVADHGALDPTDLPDPKDKIVLWEEFQAAQNLMRDSKIEEAVPALRAVIEKDPGNVMAHSSLGNALQAQGLLEEAKKEYETTVALDPRRIQGRVSLARIYRKEGNVTAAFDALKQALAQDRTAPELANEFADLFQETGNTDKAIQWYEEALRRDPLYTKALIGLSNTYHRAKRDTDAREALERCLEIDPRNADALYNLGVILEGEGKDEEALAQYRRALEIEPDHVPALNNLGSYFDRKGEVPRAIATYRRVLELTDKHFEATYNLGTLLLRAKRYDEAVPLLERAMELNPRQGVVYNNLAMGYIELERYDDAIALLEKVAEADPNTAAWWLRLARVEMKAGREASARKHFDRAVAIGGEALRARFADDPVLGVLATAGQ
jgi:arylsulfatase A-like enzyme/Tfp pilus assembly protein PilF